MYCEVLTYFSFGKAICNGPRSHVKTSRSQYISHTFYTLCYLDKPHQQNTLMGSSFTSQQHSSAGTKLKNTQTPYNRLKPNLKVHSLKVFDYLGFTHPILSYHQEVFEVPNPALSSREATVCGLAKIFIFKITPVFVETVIFYLVQNQRFLRMAIFVTNKQKLTFQKTQATETNVEHSYFHATVTQHIYKIALPNGISIFQRQSRHLRITMCLQNQFQHIMHNYATTYL